MKVLRTPEKAFAAIADFPFAPHYSEVRDPASGTSLRVHYIDEGPRDAPVVLMMHGEPTWCYLYRHMIGPVVAAGYRVSPLKSQTIPMPPMSRGCANGWRGWTSGTSRSRVRTGAP